MVRIEGRRLDVVTRGEWIGAGERVRVVDVAGNRIVVARAETRSVSP
jgi:membrane-bound ClpP family serine protease